MLIYGQIPSNAMPALSWPAGAKVGGLGVPFTPQEPSGSGGADAIIYQRGRKVGDFIRPQDDEFLPFLVSTLPILCP